MAEPKRLPAPEAEPLRPPAALFEVDDDDRAVPAPQPVQAQDQLSPTPPSGWYKVYAITDVQDAIDPAIWVVLIRQLQDAVYVDRVRGQRNLPFPTARRRLYQVCRTLEGHRLLVVHPSLLPRASDVVETVDSCLRHCNCGGSDCIEPVVLLRANRVFARRAWSRLNLPQRVELLSCRELPLEHARDPGVQWMQEFPDGYTLNEIHQTAAWRS